MNETSPTKSKAAPTPPPSVKVVEAHNTSMDNFPSSVETAAKQLEKWLTSLESQGYRYHGTISRDVGSESRQFYIFYRQ